MNFHSADHMLWGIIRDVISTGHWEEARGRKYKDCPMWTGCLVDPRARVVTNPERGLRVGYPAASVAWNLAERNDVNSICWWNEKGRAISDDGETFYGANYGQRMAPYIDEALTLLHLDSGSRRAFIPVWRPEDLIDSLDETVRYHYSRNGKDVPCTIGFGLKMRHGHLDMQVMMRSNSGFFVFPYDLYLFSVYQELLANEIGAQLGYLYWSAMSMHMFESDMDIALKALKWCEQGGMKGVTPMMPIRSNYSTARAVYPKAMEQVMAGEKIEEWYASDPIVQQLMEGK